MKTIYSPLHLGHSGTMELISGAIVPAFEKPSRAEIVKARIEKQGVGPILPPNEHDVAAAARVHRADYIDFLPTVWPLWEKTGRERVGHPLHLADAGACAAMSAQRRSTPCSATIPSTAAPPSSKAPGQPIKSSYDVALTAAGLVKSGERTAFALCRPPGHHAGSAFMGGYCYINNAAVVAQWYRDQGAARVSILDVDYHHGNGTQEIFYSRDDVQVLNLHADPMVEYPYFLGHADERGDGAGHGFNHNYPMPFGTDWGGWSASLDDACGHLAAYAPGGRGGVAGRRYVREGSDQPVQAADATTFRRSARRIAALGLPTLFVMEGGYAVDEIGVNAVGVLEGFLGS